MDVEYEITLKVRKRIPDIPEDINMQEFVKLRNSLLRWIARNADSGVIEMMHSGDPVETDDEMVDRWEREVAETRG